MPSSEPWYWSIETDNLEPSPDGDGKSPLRCTYCVRGDSASQESTRANISRSAIFCSRVVYPRVVNGQALDS
jgi:hypothetical protein